MTAERTHPRRQIARATGLVAATVGLVATSALAFSSEAPAAPATKVASKAPHLLGAKPLSLVNRAVSRSGVDGIAWYVNAASRRVVVTADRTVSTAELARVRRMAGMNSGLIRVQHVAGRFRPLLSAGNAIYGGGYRCSLGFN